MSGKDLVNTRPVMEATHEVLLGLRLHLETIPEDSTQKSEHQNSYLLEMIQCCLEHPEWPLDKTSRWLGFIQGVMSCRGILEVGKERDRTRELFHRAYEQSGQSVPKTVKVKSGK